MRLLADSNIILRTAQESHPQSGPTKAALALLVEHGHDVCIVPQVLHEVWAVATRPAEQNGLGLSIDQASTLLTDVRTNFVLLDDRPGLTAQWQQLVVTHEAKGKSSHDTRLVAAMQLHGVDHVLTFNDADFRRYSWLTVLTPPDVAKSLDELSREDKARATETERKRGELQAEKEVQEKADPRAAQKPEPEPAQRGTLDPDWRSQREQPAPRVDKDRGRDRE